MAYNKIIDQEIEDPVQDHVSSSAGCITEDLFWNPFLERPVEEINYFGDYLREFSHLIFYFEVLIILF